MRHMSIENSIAQGKLQEALAHHTAAHQQTVQAQVEALAAGIAHQSRRATSRDQMQREAMQALSNATASQIAALPKPDTMAIQQSLERMRIETAAARAQAHLVHDGTSDQQLAEMKKNGQQAATASTRQEFLPGQIGNALGDVFTHVHGQSTGIQQVIDAVSKKPVVQQYVDNRSQQNVLNQDNRSVSMEQKILNVFNQGVAAVVAVSLDHHVAVDVQAAVV